MIQVPREGRVARRNIILYNLRYTRLISPHAQSPSKPCKMSGRGRTHLLKRLKHGNTPRITPHDLHLRKLRTKAHNCGMHLTFDAGTEGCACPMFREMRKDARSMVHCHLRFLCRLACRGLLFRGHRKRRRGLVGWFRGLWEYFCGPRGGRGASSSPSPSCCSLGLCSFLRCSLLFLELAPLRLGHLLLALLLWVGVRVWLLLILRLSCILVLVRFPTALLRQWFLFLLFLLLLLLLLTSKGRLWSLRGYRNSRRRCIRWDIGIYPYRTGFGLSLGWLGNRQLRSFG